MHKRKGAMVQKKALITGVAGQDGAYLARFLLDKGYEVHGLVRWDSYVAKRDGLRRLNLLGVLGPCFSLRYGDVSDAHNIASVIKSIKPDEIYNLAALSHVQVSFDVPASSFDINAHGILNILEAVRCLDMEERVRIYQASSSEMFGKVPAPQNEMSVMQPCSPYGVSKLAGYHLARLYRESYGLWVCNGILFNHESPLRGEDFVTHKVTRYVAELEHGYQKPLSLGNLEAIRDWGDARDYVRGMWMMMQAEEPDDFVLASGQAQSVRAFVDAAFSSLGYQIEWCGSGLDELGVDAETGDVLVKIDEAFYRPLELDHLLGDASKAKDILAWKPEIGFEQMLRDMIEHDRKIISLEGNGDG